VIQHTGGPGIVADSVSTVWGWITDNTVLGAGGAGIVVPEMARHLIEATERVAGNIVGRNRGDGIVVQLANPSLQGITGVAWGNTSYANAGAGMIVDGATADSIRNNVAAYNGGCGVRWLGSAPAILACNDWYQNGSGAACTVPGATDLAVAPQFCDMAHDSVTLAAGSALLGGACGQIGARGQGCVVAAGAPPVLSVDVGLRAWPVPARSFVHFAWAPRAGAAAVEVFDVAGARQRRITASASRGSVDWLLDDGRGGRAAPGAYFARLSVDGAPIATRLVLVR
jgi:hypothetical protein